MPRRPWPIVILALLQLLSPLGSLLVSASLSDASILSTLSRLFETSSFITLVDYFFVPVLLGGLIYWANRLGYIFIIFFVAINIVQNISEWTKLPQDRSGIALLIAVNLVNLALVLYLALPQVRALFMNSRLRWWEAKPRYITNLPANARLVEETTTANDSRSEWMTARLYDISVGGMSIDVPSGSFPKNSAFRVTFQFQKWLYDLSAEIVYERKLSQSQMRVGLKYLPLPLDEKWRLDELIDALKKIGAPQSRELAPWKEDLKAWARGATKNPKAWLPNLSSETVKASKKTG